MTEKLYQGDSHYNLSNKNLSEFPKSLLGLENLRVINLWGNQIQSVPHEIENMKNLRMLNLGENPLDENSRQFLRKLKQKNICVYYSK